MGYMDAILPTHWRTGGGSLLPAARKSSSAQLRLLVALISLVAVVCFASVLFLPDLQINLRSLDQLPRHVQRLGGELLLPPPPPAHVPADDALPDVVRRHGGFVGQIEDPHKAQDRERLHERVRSALEHPPRPIGRPRSLSRSYSPVDISSASPVAKDPPLNVPISSVIIQGGEDADPDVRAKRDFIKQMMLHAWNGYVANAWGSNEVRPVSKRSHTANIFGRKSMGATIVDAMDTLFIMGLTDQFTAGRDWIQQHLSVHNADSHMSLFEVNIRFVGGLLSCYSLTGDTMFRDRAESIVRSLLPAFNTPTGIPYSLVNPTTGNAKNFAWASSGSSILSEFGTLHMEFAYLSDVTGNPEYRLRVERIRDLLDEMDKPNGLYPNYLHPGTGRWSQRHVSVGALGDSFYEYLLKEYVRSGGRDVIARRMYDEAIGNITSRLMRVSRQSNLTYFVEMQYERDNHKMDHLACFIGGLYALGSVKNSNSDSGRYMQVAREITHMCHETYDRSETKLGPESFRFTEAVEARSIRSQEKYYILRPEVIESYFVLWRLTGDSKYRQWGWEAAQAIERHCRAEAGYSGIDNVYSTSPRHDDLQQSFFLAETLKYLYLLFSDNSLISLDQWVFNTEAHPLPVRGVNPLFRAANVVTGT